VLDSVRSPLRFLLVLFLLIDVGQALAVDWAESLTRNAKRSDRRYVRLTVVVFESCFAILVGLAMTVARGGLASLHSCVDPQLLLNFAPVAFFLATGLSLKMMAVNHLHAGSIKVVGQLRLPCLVFLSTLLLGRRYSMAQWLAIGIITTSCSMFVLAKGGARERAGKAWTYAGICQVLAWVLLNVVGGIVAEHAYKSRRALPYYVQKMSSDFCFLFVSLLMLFVVVPYFRPDENILDRRRRPGGFFDSWDIRTLVVVIFLYLDALVGNLLLKEFSGVTRSITKSCGVAVVYFVSLIYAKGGRNSVLLSLSALMVILSSMLFAIIS